MCRSDFILDHVAISLNTDEWKGKKVVLVSVPGAFTVRPSFVVSLYKFGAALRDAFVRVKASPRGHG